MLPGGDPGEYRSWDPMEIGLNDKLVKKGLTLDSALCWPLTSTTVLPGGDLGEQRSRDPMEIGLNDKLVEEGLTRVRQQAMGPNVNDSQKPLGGRGYREVAEPRGKQERVEGYGYTIAALLGGEVQNPSKESG